VSFRRSFVLLAAVLGLVLWTAGASGAIPPHAVGYDPADGPASEDDAQHGGTGGHLAPSSANVEVVGKLKLTNVASGISDVGAFRNHAYLGASFSECLGRPGAQGTGVHVVNISNPAAPVKVAKIPAHANSAVGEGVHVINVATPFFSGDLLVHNNEACDGARPFEGGVSLWNVSTPAAPVRLAGGVGDSTPAISPNIGGVHSVHSAFAWYVPGANPPATGRAFVMMADNQEVDDVDILEVTNPAAPVLISETGFNNWPDAHSPLANGDTVFNHDFQIKKVGTKWLALVSYWDAGWVILDVTNPAAPVFVNDSNYPTPDPLTGFDIPEGNGHQAWWSSDNQFIIGTDEDFSPTRTNCRIESGPSAGASPCGEFGFSAPLSTKFPSGFTGTTVWGGSGCIEDVDGNGTGDRAEVLANHTRAQTGAEAIVFTRGVCFFSDKIRTAEEAGYEMVLVGQSHGGSRNGLLPDSFFCGGQGSPVLGTASAVCVGHRAMHNLFNDAPAYTGADLADMPAKGTLGAEFFAQGGVFDGWGYVHLLNANSLQEIDAYAVPEGLDPAFRTGFGSLSVHEVQTDPRPNSSLAYISYYDAGFRVIKFGKHGIREVGHFIDVGGNDFWGIEPIQLGRSQGAPLVPSSDRDFGLYIFSYTGD
jgi:hypothetical protein